MRGAIYAGLDLGSSTMHLVALDAAGVRQQDQKWTTSEKHLRDAIEPLGPNVHLHVEACELAG